MLFTMINTMCGRQYEFVADQGAATAPKHGSLILIITRSKSNNRHMWKLFSRCLNPANNQWYLHNITLRNGLFFRRYMQCWTVFVRVDIFSIFGAFYLQQKDNKKKTTSNVRGNQIVATEMSYSLAFDRSPGLSAFVSLKRIKAVSNKTFTN